MKKLLLLSVLLMISNTSMAQIMLDQSCANGAGYAYKGRYSGEFCISKKQMAWWDAIGMRLIELNEKDCIQLVKESSFDTCKNIYSQPWPTEEMPTYGWHAWTATPRGTTKAYTLEPSNGHVSSQTRDATGAWGGWALCVPK